jgi:hypothetical protein
MEELSMGFGVRHGDSTLRSVQRIQSPCPAWIGHDLHLATVSVPEGYIRVASGLRRAQFVNFQGRNAPFTHLSRLGTSTSQVARRRLTQPETSMI